MDSEAPLRLRAIVKQRASVDEADDLLRRLDHLVVEHAHCVPDAADALRSGNVERFGRAVARSQQATDEKLGNLVDETRFLADEALRQGALAASAFGAGFGGSVWAMTQQHEADEVIQRWRTAYRQRFVKHEPRCRFFRTHPAPPATHIP